MMVSQKQKDFLPHPTLYLKLTELCERVEIRDFWPKFLS